MARHLDPQVALGLAVRQLREQRSLTQEDIAHEAGLTTSAISKIERGHSNPSWSTVRSIAVALGVTTAELAALAEKLG
jgi:transcriptional regulator with XRE-family HTH domain